MCLFRTKPRKTHYRVWMDIDTYSRKYHEMYLIDKETCDYLFKKLPGATGSRGPGTMHHDKREYIFNTWWEKNEKEGKIKRIQFNEHQDIKCYSYSNELFDFDAIKYSITHPKFTLNDIVIGSVLGIFLGALSTGTLFGWFLIAFGLCSLLLSGVVLGRDLEKDYKD